LDLTDSILQGQFYYNQYIKDCVITGDENFCID